MDLTRLFSINFHIFMARHLSVLVHRDLVLARPLPPGLVHRGSRRRCGRDFMARCGHTVRAVAASPHHPEEEAGAAPERCRGSVFDLFLVLGTQLSPSTARIQSADGFLKDRVRCHRAIRPAGGCANEYAVPPETEPVV